MTLLLYLGKGFHFFLMYTCTNYFPQNSLLHSSPSLKFGLDEEISIPFIQIQVIIAYFLNRVPLDHISPSDYYLMASLVDRDIAHTYFAWFVLHSYPKSEFSRLHQN